MYRNNNLHVQPLIQELCLDVLSANIHFHFPKSLIVASDVICLLSTNAVTTFACNRLRHLPAPERPWEMKFSENVTALDTLFPKCQKVQLFASVTNELLAVYI